MSLFSLLSWLLAAWVTWKYAEQAISLFDRFGWDPTIQRIAAYLVVFFATLAIAAAISAILARTIVVGGLIGIDRTLGAAFGIVRGGLIVLILAVVGSYTSVVNAPWWQESYLLDILEPSIMRIQQELSTYTALATVTGQAIYSKLKSMAMSVLN